MLDSASSIGAAALISFAALMGIQKMMGDGWPKLGSGFQILWLFGYPAGGEGTSMLSVI